MKRLISLPLTMLALLTLASCDQKEWAASDDINLVPVYTLSDMTITKFGGYPQTTVAPIAMDIYRENNLMIQTDGSFLVAHNLIDYADTSADTLYTVSFATEETVEVVNVEKPTEMKDSVVYKNYQLVGDKTLKVGTLAVYDMVDNQPVDSIVYDFSINETRKYK